MLTNSVRSRSGTTGSSARPSPKEVDALLLGFGDDSVIFPENVRGYAKLDTEVRT